MGKVIHTSSCTNGATEHGITVIKVEPAYTSQRCNHCGFVHNKVRKEVYRSTQEQFICINCKHEVNADLNAARNTMDDIEEIIKKSTETPRGTS
ncbi:zinc ribbon domain-containing protein [Lysinibacillus sp. CTST325]